MLYDPRDLGPGHIHSHHRDDKRPTVVLMPVECTAGTPAIKTWEAAPDTPTQLLSAQPCSPNDIHYLSVGSKNSTRPRAIHSTYVLTAPTHHIGC
jgi:hypothetical protein